MCSNFLITSKASYLLSQLVQMLISSQILNHLHQTFNKYSVGAAAFVHPKMCPQAKISQR